MFWWILFILLNIRENFFIRLSNDTINDTITYQKKLHIEHIRYKYMTQVSLNLNTFLKNINRVLLWKTYFSLSFSAGADKAWGCGSVMPPNILPLASKSLVNSTRIFY